MSDYVKLMELRKQLLFAGKEEQAEKVLNAAEKLVEDGKVSDDEMLAGAYI